MTTERKHRDDAIVYSFEEILASQVFPKAYGRKFVVVEKYEELKAENAELTQSELECRQLYNEFVGELNTARIKNVELNSEITQLKSDLSIAVEALKYYADENNWQDSHPEYTHKCELYDDSEGPTKFHLVAGLRARKALSKIKTKVKE